MSPALHTTEQLENTYGDFYTPEFSIEIEGVEIKTREAEVASVTVDKSLNEAGHFSFSVNNPYVFSTSKYKWEGSDFFEIGKKIVISAGYANGDKVKLLKGFISSIKYSFPSNGASQLDVSGYDYMYLMMKSQRLKERTWNNKKYTAIIKDIISNYSEVQTGKIDDTLVEYPQVKQEDREKDFDFIKKLANETGFDFCISNDNKFILKDPTGAVNPDITLALGKNLLSFSPEFNITQQVSEVSVIGWDPAAKKEIKGVAKAGSESGVGGGSKSGSEIMQSLVEKTTLELRRPVRNQAHADSIAKAALDQSSQGLVKGSGESIGIPAIEPGLLMKLEGIGNRFSQNYYIEKVTHTIGTSGYKTTFNVRRNSI